ncbi:hypothetical protein [Streptomyces sp. NPDC049916]|uniref:hypothetical protein n=1 Tax=Streptomyces sp. NPDC049916 TaxID=3155156 RepID=UPI003425D042
MPTPQRAEQPRQQPPTPVPSALSMKDLLASCAAASAVSTPPPSGPDAADEEYPPDTPVRGHAA